jgi:LPXTG-motif cell wall-anchored protein
VKFRLAIATLITGAALALPLSAAYADVIPGASSAPPSPQVVGTGGAVAPSTAQAAPAVQAVTAAPSGSSLPLTGGDVTSLSLIGIALLGGGVVLVRRTRHQSAKIKD